MCDIIYVGMMYHRVYVVGWVLFILSPSFYSVERLLPILLHEACTEPIRRAVCDGVLLKKGVRCEAPRSHDESIGLFGHLTGQPTFLQDYRYSIDVIHVIVYIYVSIYIRISCLYVYAFAFILS